MAFAPHALLTFGGSLGNSGGAGLDSTDEWSCNIRVEKPVTGGHLDDPATNLNDIKTPLQTWFTSSTHGLSNTATLAFVKLNNIDPDGTYTTPTDPHTHLYPSPASGGNAPLVPSFLSVSIGWRTSIARGPGSHGRIYLPNFTYTGAGTSYLNSGSMSSIVQTGKDLLSLILSPGLMVPVIASKVTGVNTPVTKVVVGNVWDVQRRRKQDISETYTTAAWPG